MAPRDPVEVGVDEPDLADLILLHQEADGPIEPLGLQAYPSDRPRP